MIDDDDVLAEAAAELRRVADQLESDDLTLTEPVRYTRVGTPSTTLPGEVEIEYYDEDYGVERNVEVWI